MELTKADFSLDRAARREPRSLRSERRGRRAANLGSRGERPKDVERSIAWKKEEDSCPQRTVGLPNDIQYKPRHEKSRP